MTALLLQIDLAHQAAREGPHRLSFLMAEHPVEHLVVLLVCVGRLPEAGPVVQASAIPP